MRAARRLDAKNASKLLQGATSATNSRGAVSHHYPQHQSAVKSTHRDVSSLTTRNKNAIRKVGKRTAPSTSVSAPRPGASAPLVNPLQELTHRRKYSAVGAAAESAIVERSSIKTTKNNNMGKLMDYKAAKEMTQILNVRDFQKPGSFSDSTWQQMSHLIQSWTRFRTAESVESSLALLERLVLEQEVLMQNSRSNATSPGGPSVVQRLMSEKERRELQLLSRDILSTDLLNAIIKSWRNSWKANESNISPMAMLSQLERYIARSPSLHPDSKTYNMVMDASTTRFNHSMATKVTEDIVKRMTNNLPGGEPSLSTRINTTPTLNGKLRCRNDISPDEYTYTTLMNVYANAGNPTSAEALLNRLHRDYSKGKSHIQPTVRTFTACIKAWAKSKTVNAPEQAESLVKLMKRLDQDGSLQNVKPNVFTYNSLIDCWSKSGRKDAGENADRILQKMEASDDVQPDRISYNSVIYTWAHISKNIEQAEAVLRRMFYSFKSGNYAAKPDLDSYHFILEELQRIAGSDDEATRKAEMYLKRTKRSGLIPNLKTYNFALTCWAKSKASNAGGAAEALLREMKAPPGEHDRYAPVPVKPNSRSYSSVITAYANNGQAKQAEMIFKSMYREYNRGNTSVKPKLRNFNTVLAAWDKCKSVSDNERVKAMVKLLADLPKTGALSMKPDIISANTLLHCLAKSDAVESQNYAESVLSSLETDYEATKDPSLRPDKYSYTSLMRAHANVGDLYNTKETLKRMMAQYANGNEAAKPDIFCFNNVLLAIARGSRGRNSDAGLLAEEVFKEMQGYKGLDIHPNRASYTLKINCWAASGDSQTGEQADRILEEMEQLAAAGHPEMKPDAITISNAIHAHAKCGNPVKAEALLKQMLADYSNGNSRMRPTLQTINMFLASLAKANTKDHAEKADAYLREMLAFQDSLSSFDLQPDAVTFTTVISAWANSGDPKAAERAKALFREAEMLSQSPDHKLVLDAGFYRSVIRACALSGDVIIAESLLQDIVDGDEFGNVKPDRFMYLALLEAYSKSDLMDAAEKAEALLIRMNTLAEETGNSSINPDSACYRFVLECWSTKSDNLKMAADRSEALLRAMEKKVNSGESNLKPDPATYKMVINTMSRAGDTEGAKWVLKQMYDDKGKLEAFVPAA